MSNSSSQWSSEVTGWWGCSPCARLGAGKDPILKATGRQAEAQYLVFYVHFLLSNVSTTARLSCRRPAAARWWWWAPPRGAPFLRQSWPDSRPRCRCVLLSLQFLFSLGSSPAAVVPHPGFPFESLRELLRTAKPGIHCRPFISVAPVGPMHRVFAESLRWLSCKATVRTLGKLHSGYQILCGHHMSAVVCFFSRLWHLLSGPFSSSPVSSTWGQALRAVSVSSALTGYCNMFTRGFQGGRC